MFGTHEIARFVILPWLLVLFVTLMPGFKYYRMFCSVTVTVSLWFYNIVVQDYSRMPRHIVSPVKQQWTSGSWTSVEGKPLCAKYTDSRYCTSLENSDIIWQSPTGSPNYQWWSDLPTIIQVQLLSIQINQNCNLLNLDSWPINMGYQRQPRSITH